MPDAGIWLTGWLMIVVHFASSIFLLFPGTGGSLATFIGLASLAWAGILFMWAMVPNRKEISSIWMVASILVAHTLYIAVLSAGPGWALSPAAILIGAGPMTVGLVALRGFNHWFRWLIIIPYCVLSGFLLVFEHRAGYGADLAINALLFNIYLGCSVHFIYRYRHATAGAFITITGFLAWAMVFLAAPVMTAYFPDVHVENEVWDLPKYLVAVGMMLLLLEKEIEHNRHLALHDHLTGLPNRRLYQDRLASAIERARRSGTQTALLVIDLDAFKQVNDTLGHHVGDLLLKRIGTILSQRVRRSDTAARTGGDEFSVILEEPVNRDDALRVGESLKKLINEPMRFGEETVHVGASIGIAIFPEDAADVEELCIAADLRMYSTKHDFGAVGKNITGAFPEL
jgi:diguanylate cyclase (GGDEF)-like protein